MSSDDPIVRRFSLLDRASPLFSDELFAMLGQRTMRANVACLSAQDSAWLVDYLDDVCTSFLNSWMLVSEAGVDSRSHDHLLFHSPEMPTGT